MSTDHCLLQVGYLLRDIVWRYAWSTQVSATLAAFLGYRRLGAVTHWIAIVVFDVQSWC